jgi:hypothetical protein
MNCRRNSRLIPGCLCNGRGNNEFKLNFNAGVRPDDSVYTGRENRYSRYHTDYGVTYWK